MDGDNTQLDGKHEPEMETRLGTGDKELDEHDLGEIEEDTVPLNVTEIVSRFEEQTRARLRAETQADYVRAFRRFCMASGLKDYSRRQVAGPKGRELVLRHLEAIPKPSWGRVVAALKPVWTYGLGLPWPIDSKRDLGRLPGVRRRESPNDSVMKAWKKALAFETDLYLKLVWLLIAQHGWRPSHVCKMKWRNVRFGEDGKPYAIVADGVRENFKTCSPIAAHLSLTWSKP